MKIGWWRGRRETHTHMHVSTLDAHRGTEVEMSRSDLTDKHRLKLNQSIASNNAREKKNDIRFTMISSCSFIQTALLCPHVLSRVFSLNCLSFWLRDNWQSIIFFLPAMSFNYQPFRVLSLSSFSFSFPSSSPLRGSYHSHSRVTSKSVAVIHPRERQLLNIPVCLLLLLLLLLFFGSTSDDLSLSLLAYVLSVSAHSAHQAVPFPSPHIHAYWLMR